MKKINLFLLMGALLFPAVSEAQDWQMKQGKIMTPWSENIDPENVLNEYPRPQKKRAEWMNLNGIWDLARREEGKSAIGTYRKEAYNKKILVPFPVESPISGIMDTDYSNQNKSYVYRRYFALPESMKGKHILLNFGAVDWYCAVFINGTKVGSHSGGYDPFSFDITNALKEDGDQEIVVQVYDPTDGGAMHGKQALSPAAIDYAPSSGIWQTVWLEPVEETYITDFRIIPDVDNSQVKIKVEAENAEGYIVEVTVIDDETPVATQIININEETNIPLGSSEVKLWSPDSPFLYDLRFELKKDDVVADKVDSYFGMRKIELGKLRGRPYMFLNDKPLFQYGPLDQGFWPDGNYTAPSYEAWKWDIEKMKEFGFNMIRKHIKTEPARWYYYCDSIGLVVWQDMPNSSNEFPDQTKLLGNNDWVKRNFLKETENIVKSLINVPSIIVWVPYNENWGQFGAIDPSHTINGVNLIRKLDNTRLINPASGWVNYELGDIVDRHSYPKPGIYDNAYNKRATVCGETEGYGLKIDGHMYTDQYFSWTEVNSTQELSERMNEVNDLAFGLTGKGLNAIVITQFTDVEKEINGLYTYDRKVRKLEDDQFESFKTGVIKLKTKALGDYVYPSAVQCDTLHWYYTISTSSPATGWNTDSDFDVSNWKYGLSGFGQGEMSGARIRTEWNGKNSIYLRRNFDFSKLSDEEFNGMKLSIFNDEDFEVYINGVLAASGTGYVTDYRAIDLTDEVKNAIRRTGNNLIAVKCTQDWGGQYIDLGFVTEIPLDYEKNEGETPEVIVKKISTPEEFDAIRNDLGGFYELTADIDLSKFTKFLPIGSETAPFTGFIDGKGYAVKNMKITNSGVNNQGLFGYTEGAVIRNLELENCKVIGAQNVGTLFGKGRATTVENVVVTKPSLSGTDHVGGIGGATVNGGLITSIKNCYVTDGNVWSSDLQLGGIIGSAKNTEIENVYYTGKLVGSTNESCNVGGIVGLIESDEVYINNVVSLASSLKGGMVSPISPKTTGEYKKKLITFGTNMYASNAIEVVGGTVDPELGDLAASYKKPLSDLQKRSFYEGIGWDFVNVWSYPEGTLYPVLKFKEGDVSGLETVQKVNVMNVSATGGNIIIETKKPASVWIYNAAGALISRVNTNGNIITQSVPAGSYIVKAVIEGQAEIVKIISE